VTTTQRSRLGLLRLVVFGTIAVPAFAATSSGIALFGGATGVAGSIEFVTAPPPLLFVVLGVSMVAWAVTRRHLKSLADLRRATET
jgi:hypothetical protein